MTRIRNSMDVGALQKARRDALRAGNQRRAKQLQQQITLAKAQQFNPGVGAGNNQYNQAAVEKDMGTDNYNQALVDNQAMINDPDRVLPSPGGRPSGLGSNQQAISTGGGTGTTTTAPAPTGVVQPPPVGGTPGTISSVDTSVGTSTGPQKTPLQIAAENKSMQAMDAINPDALLNFMGFGGENPQLRYDPTSAFDNFAFADAGTNPAIERLLGLADRAESGVLANYDGARSNIVDQQARSTQGARDLAQDTAGFSNTALSQAMAQQGMLGAAGQRGQQEVALADAFEGKRQGALAQAIQALGAAGGMFDRGAGLDLQRSGMESDLMTTKASMQQQGFDSQRQSAQALLQNLLGITTGADLQGQQIASQLGQSELSAATQKAIAELVDDRNEWTTKFNANQAQDDWLLKTILGNAMQDPEVI